MLRNNRPYLLLLPFLLIFAVPLVFSIYSMVKQSLGIVPGLGLERATPFYYISVVNSEAFYTSLRFSIVFSSIASFVSVCIGFVMAFLLAEEKEEGIITSILRLPILIPHFTAAFLVFMLLSQSGLISRIVENMGLIADMEQFPKLIFDSFGLGIIVSYMWKEIPFCILFLYPTLRLMRRGLRETAYVLGASRLQYFYYVALPACRSSVISLFIILAAYNFGAFEVPFILGASYPKAIGVLGYISYLSADLNSRPFTMALNVMITAMGVLLIFLYMWLVKKIKSIEGQL